MIPSMVFMVSEVPGYLSSVPWYKSILRYISTCPWLSGFRFRVIAVIRRLGVIRVVGVIRW